MSLMLERELNVKEEKDRKNKSIYLDLLGKLIGIGAAIHQSGASKSVTYRKSSISKFTKTILTQSFWLHIHFFVHDNKIFDPFIFESTKGNISICILAYGESVDITDIKGYLHHPINNSPIQVAPDYINREASGIVKPEIAIEGKIESLIH
jgi:hypothetical protein